MVGNKAGYDDNGFNMEGYNIKGEFNEYIDSVEELHDGNAKQVVINNVLYNKPYADKVPIGAELSVVTFIIENKEIYIEYSVEN